MFPGMADFDLSVDDHARAAGPPHALVVRLVILLHQSLPGRARGAGVVARLARLPEPTTAGLALSAGLAEGVCGEDTKIGGSRGFGDDSSSVGGMGVEVHGPG